MGLTTRGGTRLRPPFTDACQSPYGLRWSTRRITVDVVDDDVSDDALDVLTLRAERLTRRDEVGPLGGARDGQSDLTARRVDCGAMTAVSSNPARVELIQGMVHYPIPTWPHGCEPRARFLDPTMVVSPSNFIRETRNDCEVHFLSHFHHSPSSFSRTSAVAANTAAPF